MLREEGAGGDVEFLWASRRLNFHFHFHNGARAAAVVPRFHAVLPSDWPVRMKPQVAELEHQS